ncbi:MAG: hypothetical protein H0V88_00770 [Pyrinomonadaceae bacterium]|nr:hypothetical protein [Pyrinomonadaceae bacterium]
MNDRLDDTENETLQAIIETLMRAGDDALLQQRSAKDAAQAWIAAGFDDAEEVEEWLAARCFDPRFAETLETAGFTPAQAGIHTKAGANSDEDTIAYKIANGDLSLDEARRIITRVFWHE